MTEYDGDYVKIDTREEMETWVKDGGWESVEDFEQDLDTTFDQLQGQYFLVIDGQVFIKDYTDHQQVSEEQCQALEWGDGEYVRCENKAIAEPIKYDGDEQYEFCVGDEGQDWPLAVSVRLCPVHNPERIVCFDCHRDMTKDEIGDEFPQERVCLQCVERALERITDVVQGADHERAAKEILTDLRSDEVS